ncbi:XRE family transcriptional regulator [Enterococcus sp. S86.2]|uniref:LexA family transcriptional regulator n=1 Tax=Enterococcus sp. S86.2 TaxID=3031299 RepID=UPI0026E96B81|nr:XRE family transcriptional regulator [Enterococcus sp. S86.2]
MSIFSKELDRLMKQSDMSNEALGELVGVNRTTVSRWRSGERSPKMAKLSEIADVFNVDARIFVGEMPVSDISTIYNQLDQKRQAKVYNFADRQLREQNKKVVPLVGQTAANPTELTYGDETYDETVETNVPKSADFALVVKGDSMEPIFADGSIVFYKQQDDVENGEIAVVEIDGNGVTLKKVYFNYDDETVILRSLNDKYEDRVLHPDEVRIIGKVVK